MVVSASAVPAEEQVHFNFSPSLFSRPVQQRMWSLWGSGATWTQERSLVKHAGDETLHFLTSDATFVRVLFSSDLIRDIPSSWR